ncbi:dynein gamma flagellar outer arm-like, partial [Brachionus plicatilis]
MIHIRFFEFLWKEDLNGLFNDFIKNEPDELMIKREVDCLAKIEKQRLMVNVQTLEQLNDALRLLEELSDMENKVDKIYLPIENIYADLQRYELILTRQEIEQVSSLRDNWSQ